MMRRRINTSFFILLLVLLGWISFLIVEPFLDFVVGGLLLTFVFYPLYRRLLPYVKYPALASTIVIVLIVLIVVIPMFFAVWSIAQDVAEISRDLSVEDVQGFLETLDARIAEFTGFEILQPANETRNATGPPPDPGGTDNATGGNTTADGNGTAGGDTGESDADLIIKRGLLQPGDFNRFLVSQVEGLARTLIAESLGFVLQAFIGVFVMLFIMYYGFKDGLALKQFIAEILPLRERYKDVLFEEMTEVVDAVFIGQIFVSLVQGALGGLGFWAFGIPNPFFWGFVMTILAILPIIGTPVVWVPAGIYMLIIGDTFAGVGILLYGTVIVSTVDNFLKPKVIGDRAQIHPAVVLLGVVGGLALFGFIGFLLGPLVLAIFAVLLRLFGQDFVAREELSTPNMGRLPPKV